MVKSSFLAAKTKPFACGMRLQAKHCKAQRVFLAKALRQLLAPMESFSLLPINVILIFLKHSGRKVFYHYWALKYGRKAASLSKANGVPVSKIADSKYG